MRKSDVIVHVTRDRLMQVHERKLNTGRWLWPRHADVKDLAIRKLHHEVNSVHASDTHMSTA